MSSPKLLITADYIKEAIKAISTAKHRVMFMSLMFTDDDVTDEFVDALKDCEWVIFAEIFSDRETRRDYISSRQLAERLAILLAT